MESISPYSPTINSRVSRGAGAQVFYQTVQAVIRIAEVPLFIGIWGINLYGEWLMLSAIPAYLSLGDGGFVSASVREMSICSSAGDQKGALSIFQSTWSLLLAISLIVLLLVQLFINIAPITDWFNFVRMDKTEVRTVFLLLSGYALIGFQGSLLNGGFWCSGRYPVGIILSAVTQLLEFIGLAISIAIGGGPVQAASGYLIGRLIGTLLTCISMHRVTPWLRFGFSQGSIRVLKRLLVPALASLAFPLGNVFNIEGFRLIVGFVMGPPLVAVFSPIRTLSRFAMQPVVVINRVIEPELAISFGQRNQDVFANLFLRSCQIAIWTCIGACLIISSISYWLFPLWTDGKIAIHWPLYLLLLLTVAVHGIWHTAMMAQYATNRHGRVAIVYSMLYGVIAFFAGYTGAVILGLSGIGLALLMAEIAMAIYVIPAAIKFTNQTWKRWFISIIHPPFFLIHNCRALFRNVPLTKLL